MTLKAELDDAVEKINDRIAKKMRMQGMEGPFSLGEIEAGHCQDGSPL